MNLVTPGRLAAALALALAATGCSTGPGDAGTSASDTAPNGTAYPLRLDDCGREVTIAEPPGEVLTIGTAAVSLLDAAGAADAIAARSGEFGAPLPDDLTDPPTAAAILDPSDPTTEAILSTGAPLVYGYGLFNADADQLASAGVQVLTVAGECGHDATGDGGTVDFSTVSDDIRRLGMVFDTSAAAGPTADALDAEVAGLTRPTASAGNAAWIYFFSSADSLSAYGGTGMPAAVLTDAGLENVYGQESESYLTPDVESLLAADPDWLVLSYGLYGESEADARRQLLAVPGVGDLRAVRENRVLLVPGTASEPSPRAVQGLRLIVEATDAG